VLETKPCITKIINDAELAYNEMREDNIPAEMARGILPQFTTTSVWFGFNSPDSYRNFDGLRSSSSAQKDIQGVAAVFKELSPFAI
jgi:thymidylate synthase ThyX